MTAVQVLPILALVVMFLLSLGGSYVLFRFLKSTASIQKKGYHAGGALAGFILIYGLLYYTYDKMVRTSSPPEVATWSIEGIAQKADATNHAGITVRHTPPVPSTITDASGYFHLEGVRTVGREERPEFDLYVENERYYPVKLHISSSNARYDRTSRTITLVSNIKVEKESD